MNVWQLYITVCNLVYWLNQSLTLRMNSNKVGNKSSITTRQLSLARLWLWIMEPVQVVSCTGN